MLPLKNNMPQTLIYNYLVRARNRHLLMLDIIFFIVSPVIALMIRVEDVRTIFATVDVLIFYIAISLIAKIVINFFIICRFKIILQYSNFIITIYLTINY